MRKNYSASWIICTFFFAGISVSLPAQNIVPNNGFETNTGTPTGYGEWYRATGWNNVNMFAAFLWPYASPDYLHMTGTGGADLPASTFGTVTPYAGNAVMGFITWLASTPDFREYLSIQFSSPMVVGTTYTISFWLTNGSGGWYCGNSSNHLGVRLSLLPLSQLTHEPIGGTPQCEYAGEFWSTTWQYVSFTYVADQPYNYITIGNFFNDASTTNTWRVASFSPGAYYFIDEVVVQPATILPITLIDFAGEQIGDQIDLQWNTESELNSSSFIVEKSADGEQFEAIGSLPAAGFSEQELHYTFTDANPFSDDNFYRLKMLDNSGRSVYSNIIRIKFEDIAVAKITVGPNPCSEKLTISSSDGNDHEFSIYALSGKLIYLSRTNGGTAEVDVSGFAKGMYILRIADDDLQCMEKIMVN